MRTTVVRAAVLAGLLLGVAAFGQQPAGTKKEATDKKAEQKPAAGSLEDLIAQALRNNPDIRVAEAKVREAEAELQRIRVATAQKVAALHQAIETARQSRDTAQDLFRTVQLQHKTGHASQNDFIKAKAALQVAAAELMKLEAEMPALLGKLPGKLGEEKAKAEAAVDKNWLRLEELQIAQPLAWQAERLHLARTILLEGELPAVAPQGSIADKIRKALDTPIKADFRNKSTESVFDEFRKRLGVPLRVPRTPQGNMPGDFDLGEVPLGVAIQAFTDAYPQFRFVVRDYGILWMAKVDLPPGAIELYDFWKSGKRAENAEAEGKNPPAANLEGEVEEVDSKSGLVRLKVWRVGDGLATREDLAKGQTLEVYRLKPAPLYIGTIRILDVSVGQAAGKVIGKPHETIMKGDTVTSKLKGN